jgi:hypothetical protein
VRMHIDVTTLEEILLVATHCTKKGQNGV